MKLLRLKDEGENTWKEKLRLEDQVCRGASHLSMTDERQLQENWRAQNDKKNWILPSLESLRGDFRSNCIRMVKAYPAEGRGECRDRFNYQELAVVTNDRLQMMVRKGRKNIVESMSITQPGLRILDTVHLDKVQLLANSIDQAAGKWHGREIKWYSLNITIQEHKCYRQHLSRSGGCWYYLECRLRSNT